MCVCVLYIIYIYNLHYLYVYGGWVSVFTTDEFFKD